jgi:ATP synthase protein I
MNARNTPSQLRKLDEMLRTARDARKVSESNHDSRLSGVGFAFRIGVELVAALVVGVGIGLLLDRWLETAPWFLIGFFFIGSGAGIVNVYRATSNYGLAVGYRDPEDENVGTSGSEKSASNVTEADGKDDDAAKQ